MAEVIVENEFLLKQALADGYNLFLGAGFSLESSGSRGSLPTGAGFEKVLRREFSALNLPSQADLGTICTIIKVQSAQAFRDLCNETFRVTTYNPNYKNILKTKLKSVFTTNIDSLIPQIIDDSESHYLHDIFITGSSPSDERGISYFALHGSVLHTNRDLVFGNTEIASAYGDEPQMWNHFSQLLNMSPTVFWGYGMKDAPTLQALRSAGRQGRATNAHKWIVLLPSEKENEPYYKALGFLIIYADTSDLLKWFKESFSTKNLNVRPSDFSASNFPEYQIPNISAVPVRESSIFFEGSEPSWYDVLQKIPTETKHLISLRNIMASGRNVIVQGVPASGKTTLLKTLACGIPNYRKNVLFIDGFVDGRKADLIAKEISDSKAIIFWDNVFDQIDSLDVLTKCKNAQIVCADRDYIYQFGFHKFDFSSFDIYDCSEIERGDIQSLIKSIPDTQKNRSGIRHIETTDDPVSIFDVIQRVSKNSNISDRVQKLFIDLDKHDEIYKEIFVLISYFHNARISASFDAVASYCGLKGIGIFEVRPLLDRLGGIVREYDGAFGGEDQDYFRARSSIFAEQCVEVAPAAVLREVITNVLRHISIVKIPHYSVFQRGAFRNELFARAFPNWKDGLELYDLIFENALTDHAKPYIRQQCALYLAQKSKYREAFAAIDEAVRLSNGRVPTILHTQARIKFEANINIEDDDSEYVYNSLLNAMDQLERCYNLDIRKQRHVEYFAKFAIQLDNRYSDSDTYSRLRKAESWVVKEMSKPATSHRIKRLLRDLQISISKQS
jgi:hypothetical protein